MSILLERDLAGRARRRLERARQKGHLSARGRDGARLAEIYAAWCWSLKIPAVWSERRSPHSRYGRVHLEMFTTPNMLTARGQAKMKALAGNSPFWASAHDACWDFVPMAELERLAGAVVRAALRAGNQEPNRVKVASIETGRTTKILSIDVSREALA